MVTLFINHRISVTSMNITYKNNAASQTKQMILFVSVKPQAHIIQWPSPAPPQIKANASVFEVTSQAGQVHAHSFR